MKILQSLSIIGQNKANFPKWEIEQDNVDLKREELNKQHPPSQEELKSAKELGGTIIDVVDIMDQHSEDIAENVETATTIPMFVLPWAVSALTGLASAKFLVKPADKEEEAIRKEFLQENKAKIDDLVKRFKEESRNSDRHIFDFDIVSKSFVKRSKVSNALKNEANTLIKELSLRTKKPEIKLAAGIVIPFASLIASFIAGNVYATKLQVGSSKIARYQARKVLDDPKYFVTYTPEQVEQAKENLDKSGDKKHKKLKINKLKNGMLRGTASILKDNKEFQEWKNSDDAKAERIDRKLTEDELKQAQRDKEVVQRVVRKINNNAETYSENMEVASAVLIGGTPWLGALVGVGVSKLLNFTKIIPNAVQKMVDKYGTDNAKKAYDELSKATKDTPNKLGLLIDFADNMFELPNTSELKLSRFQKIMDVTKRSLAVALSTEKGRNVLFGVISGLATGVVGAFIGLKLQKSSARAGRYEAKQELENDPKNFIGYTDDELDSVKNLPPKQKKNKLKEYLLFVPREINMYFKYKKYTKTQLKKENILREELTKLDVSDKQLKDAKNLQRKIFNTFEQVDDKSQDYSESVEAVCEIAQPFVYTGAFLLALSPFAIFAARAAAGKVTAKKLLAKGLGFLDKSTGILQKKFFKNYLNDVANQIPALVKKTSLPYYVKYPSKYNEKDLAEFNKIKDMTYEVSQVIKSKITDINNAKSYADSILNSVESEIKEMPDEEFKQIINDLSGKINISKSFVDIDFSTVDKKYIVDNIPKVQKILKNIPDEEIKNLLNSIVKSCEENPAEFATKISDGSILKLLVTPKLVSIAAAAGVSWVALNMIVAYLIESLLADLQLKAGRLGVMKALESLDDPAYYANAK